MAKCSREDRGVPGHIQQNVNGFIHRVDFEPGYDHWTVPCEVGHGRHGMNLRFIVQGEEGATQFLMYTPWIPGSVSNIGDVADSGARTMAADLGYHWLRPTYEGQDFTHEGCDYLAGATCYYDGSGLNAGPVMAAFFEEGVDALWRILENYYLELAQEAKALAS